MRRGQHARREGGRGSGEGGSLGASFTTGVLALCLLLHIMFEILSHVQTRPSVRRGDRGRMRPGHGGGDGESGAGANDGHHASARENRGGTSSSCCIQK